MTAGGLVFIAGTKDERIHAFDKRTGQLLWEHPLPAGGYATPSTYQVNGRQYVVIAAGGAGKLRTKAGDAFVAFRSRTSGILCLPTLLKSRRWARRSVTMESGAGGGGLARLGDKGEVA